MAVTKAQARAMDNYRKKTIKKEVVINPDTHPKEADFIENKRFDGSFNQFVIKLIGQHIDQQSDDTDTQK
jgi:hypothetical protein